jgi:hypothetical protein
VIGGHPVRDLQKPFDRGVRDAALHDQIEKASLTEVGDRSGRVGLNVGVDEVAQVRLVRFEVNRVPARLPDYFAQFEVAVYFAFDSRDVAVVVAGIPTCGRASRVRKLLSQMRGQTGESQSINAMGNHLIRNQNWPSR